MYRSLDSANNNVEKRLLFMQKGIIRRLDNLGRIVLPIHYRKMVGIYENDDVEISVNELNQIVIFKHNSLSGKTKIINDIATTLFKTLGGTIIIFDEHKILASTGNKEATYQKGLEISQELKNRIQRNVTMIPFFNIIPSFEEKNATMVHPIVGRHGTILGGILYIYEKDLLENVKQILQSYAILISEMLKE